jgi:hypothetical protein
MTPLSYRRHRFPAEIIQHAIWLYSLSPLHTELPRRGGTARGAWTRRLYETVRRGLLKFGPLIASRWARERRVTAGFQTGLTKHMPPPLRVDRPRHEDVNGESSLEEASDRFIAAHLNGGWTAKTETQHRASLGMFKKFARGNSAVRINTNTPTGCNTAH